MTRQILFLDKDGTLGDWSPMGNGFYRSSKSFLKSQHSQGRELHILTTAGDGGKDHLSDIANLLSSYMGREQIQPLLGFYESEDGIVKRVDDDYKLRSVSPGLSACDLVHKETGAEFSKDTHYQNPYVNNRDSFERVLSKDIHLARRLLSQEDYDKLHVVMVGDTGDLAKHISSDPYTPLFVVNRRGAQEWRAARVAVDTLFGDGKTAPWQVYDNLAKESIPAGDNIKKITLDDMPFFLRIGENNTRSIYRDYHS